MAHLIPGTSKYTFPQGRMMNRCHNSTTYVQNNFYGGSLFNGSAGWGYRPGGCMPGFGFGNFGFGYGMNYSIGSFGWGGNCCSNRFWDKMMSWNIFGGLMQSLGDIFKSLSAARNEKPAVKPQIRPAEYAPRQALSATKNSKLMFDEKSQTYIFMNNSTKKYETLGNSSNVSIGKDGSVLVTEKGDDEAIARTLYDKNMVPITITIDYPDGTQEIAHYKDGKFVTTSVKDADGADVN